MQLHSLTRLSTVIAPPDDDFGAPPDTIPPPMDDDDDMPPAPVIANQPSSLPLPTPAQSITSTVVKPKPIMPKPSVEGSAIAAAKAQLKVNYIIINLLMVFIYLFDQAGSRGDIEHNTSETRFRCPIISFSNETNTCNGQCLAKRANSPFISKEER